MKNPFNPKRGATPPYVAGRQRELTCINDALELISEPRDNEGTVEYANPTIALIGPKGVGKTALLTLAKRKARKLGIRIVQLYKSRMANEVLASEWITNPTGAKKVMDSGVIEILGGHGRMVDGWYIPTPPEIELHIQDGLKKAVKKEPILVVIDDSHTVPFETLRNLCDIIEGLISENYAISVILAGEPSLHRRFMESGAMYLERTTWLDLNRLEKKDARDVFKQGFESTNMKIIPEYIDRLLEWSGHFPYFIQLIGHTTWQSTNGRVSYRVSKADIEAGIQNATVLRNAYYDALLAELKKHKLDVYAAQAVMMTLKAKRNIKYYEMMDGLMRANKNVDRKKAFRIEEKLKDLGFFNLFGSTLKARVPSQFTYINQNIAQEKVISS